jgi:hypothetical protein
MASSSRANAPLWKNAGEIFVFPRAVENHVAQPDSKHGSDLRNANHTLIEIAEHLIRRSGDRVGIGMADSLITRLGLLGSISVCPLAGVRFYADGTKDPQTAGRELRV